ncbi:MAG TPA: hypothetical protein VIH61_06060 [Waddliaceae bacterium]
MHRTLNSPGYVPFVGTVTGLVRIVTAVAGVAFSALAAVLSLPFNFESAKYFTVSIVVHFLNIARGIIELVPVVGGLICFLIDMIWSAINVALNVALIPVKAVI